MKVTVYSTGCPKCLVLKKKLSLKNIEYNEINSIDDMLAMGIKQVPMLSVDGGAPMNFADAVKWINSVEV